MLGHGLEQVLAAERAMVVELEGKLYPPHIYAVCRTRAHVLATLPILMDPTQYPKLVGDALTKWIASQPPETAPQGKHMTIYELRALWKP